MIYGNNDWRDYHLEHHGIQGQKWGVRRGPPYPIEDKVLRKGTRLNSVALPMYGNAKRYKNRGKWMYTYNPDDEWDTKVYKGPFSVYKVFYSGYGSISLSMDEHKYATIKDLIMPTSKERFDEFRKVFDENKKAAVKELQSIQNRARSGRIGTEGARTVNLNDMRTVNDYKSAYELFNHAMENISAFSITRKYAKSMAKKYEAMVDDNNQGIYNKVHDPIIIFNPKKTLNIVEKSSTISINEINKYYNEVKDAMEKEGKKVLL